MSPFRSTIVTCLLAAASAVAAGEPADPAGTVAGWIKALQANDLATAWDRLPETQRAAWSPSLAAPPAPAAADPAAAQQRGPRGGGGRMIDGPLRMLADGEQGGRILAAVLAGLAGAAAADGKAPPSVAMPTDQPFLAFMPRMLAAGTLGGMLQGVLARGLETRQIAAIDTWATGYAAWAATAPLSDEVRSTAAQPHIKAFAAAVQAAPAGSDARAVLAAWSVGLPRLKLALAVYGLDVDAAFASAKTEAEAPAADGSVVVDVTFTAFAQNCVLPIKMRQANGGWEIAADSPAPRWLRGGAMGMMGGGRMGGFGGGGRRGGPGGNGGNVGPAADPPADIPKSGPVGF